MSTSLCSLQSKASELEHKSEKVFQDLHRVWEATSLQDMQEEQDRVELQKESVP